MEPSGENRKLKKLVQKVKRNMFIAGIELVRIDDINSLLERIRSKVAVEFQLFDANHIAGVEHVEFAVLNALKAFQDGTNVSRSLPVEVLLYASGQRQIGQAFSLVGVTTETENLLAVIFTDSRDKADGALDLISKLTGGKLNREILIEWPKTKKAELKKVFEISNIELHAFKRKGLNDKEILTELILERVALVPTLK